MSSKLLLPWMLTNMTNCLTLSSASRMLEPTHHMFSSMWEACKQGGEGQPEFRLTVAMANGVDATVLVTADAKVRSAELLDVEDAIAPVWARFQRRHPRCVVGNGRDPALSVWVLFIHLRLEETGLQKEPWLRRAGTW